MPADLFTATAVIPFHLRATVAELLRAGHCSPQCLCAFGPEASGCSCVCQRLGYGDRFHGYLCGAKTPVETRRLQEPAAAEPEEELTLISREEAQPA